MATEEPAAAERQASIERLRLVAMLEIVAFHTLAGRRLPVIAGLGLPTFLLLSAAFSVVSADRRGPAFVAGLKLRKLGLAWLFWCAVYAVVSSALAVRHGAPWYEPFHSPWMLLYGPRIHLWFIPFSIAAGSISAYLHAATRHLDRHVISLLWLGIGGVLVFAGQTLREAPEPIHQWGFAIASIPLGMTAGYVLLGRPQERLRLVLPIAAFALVALAALPWIADAVSAETLRRFAISLLLVCACVFWQSAYDPLTRRFSPYMLGVYFVHVLIAHVLHRFTQHAPYVAPFAVFVLSLVVIEVMQRTPLRRFVVMR